MRLDPSALPPLPTQLSLPLLQNMHAWSRWVAPPQAHCCVLNTPKSTWPPTHEPHEPHELPPLLQNVRGTVGDPIPGTELRIADPTTLEPLPDGQVGLVLARGPGITPGAFPPPIQTRWVNHATREEG